MITNNDKVMQTVAEKQITEEEVMFLKVHDRETSLYPGHILPIWWNKGGEITQDEIDFADFVGWQFESGRIENYHTEGEGLVEIDADHYGYNYHRQDYVETRRGTFHYTFEQYLETVTDSDLITYKTCQS